MKFRHPSKDRLRAWLTGADPNDAELEAHIDDCERCSSVIEAMGDVEISEPLVFALAQVLAAPQNLPDRLETRVSAKLGGRELVGLMAEMFGAGMETSRLLIVDPPPQDPPT